MGLAGNLRIVPPHVQSTNSIDHDLTLVIPAYNEESRLPKALAETKSFLDAWGINYRVIVVDDGSRDATATLTSTYGLRFSTISQPNGGKGSAVRNGMLSGRGRIIAFTDADLPYDLTALKSAVQIIESKHRDVVFGSRTIEGAMSQVERRWLRSLASSIFRGFMMLLVSRQVTDTQCGLKVFSHEAARRIFSRTTVKGFAFDAEVVFLTHLLGLSFEKIAVTLVNDYSTTISLTRNAVPMLLDVIGVRLRALRGGYQADLDEIPWNSESTTANRKAA